MRLRCFALLLATILTTAACPTRDKYGQMPTLRITSPATNTTYTNGIVRITAAIDPVLELPIVLLENGTELATLMPPLFSFDWPTAGVLEGAHTITAEVAFSSETARSAPITIVVDRTRPTVTRTPAPGARNVALRAPIQAAFSEPIVLNEAAATTFSLAVAAGSPIATQAILDAAGMTVTIAIDDLAGLFLPTSLLATIAPTITDRAGNPLAPPSDGWSWNVPDFVKAPALPLCSSLPSFNQLPAFAVGSDLKPVLAWASTTTRSDGVHCQLALNRYENDAWATLLSLPEDVNSAMRGATVALAADDTPFVAWRPGSLPDPGEIHLVAASDNAWQALPPLLPQVGVSFPIVYPVLRIAPDAAPVLLWGAGSSADRYLMARGTEAGWREDFGPLPIISQEPFDGVHFDMILAEDGSPLVSWINPANRGHLSAWNGTAWSAAPEVVDMIEPSIALDSARAPMIVSGGSGSFFVQHLTNDNLWQPQPTAAIPPQARHPRIAAGPDGLPVLAWYDGQTKSVGMGRWTGRRWDVRAYAFSPTNARDEAPQLIVDRQSTAWVGWRDSAGQFNLWMSNY